MVTHKKAHKRIEVNKKMSNRIKEIRKRVNSSNFRIQNLSGIQFLSTNTEKKKLEKSFEIKISDIYLDLIVNNL